MPTTRRSRVVAAPVEDVWRVVRDPHHLPRWWPKVARVEGVGAGFWTKVMLTQKGKPVRADFRLVEQEEPRLRVWEQELEDSPFERFLGRQREEVHLEPAGETETRVTIVSTQKLRGMARFGGVLMRRATRRQLDEALEGLERAVGR